MQLLLPVILFVLTLAIIFLLRAGDKKEKSFSRVMDMKRASRQVTKSACRSPPCAN